MLLDSGECPSKIDVYPVGLGRKPLNIRGKRRLAVEPRSLAVEVEGGRTR
jgi:hypothetical protein